MGVCGSCGAELRAGVSFCTQCGASVSARRRGVVWFGVAGAIALLVALVVLVWTDNDSIPGVPSAADGTTTGVSNPTAPTPTDPVSAEQALRAEVAADRSAAEMLVGRWIPQLSSKRLGLVTNGVTYGYPEIHADFQTLKARYPKALLVWSGDFSSFRAGDFWVTMVSIDYATGEEANAWCDRQRIGAGDCYAKRLSHTGGYPENTLHRG